MANVGTVSAKGWRWVLSALTQPATVNNKAARCRVPIVDCIFWDGGAAAAVEWIWANKNGQVVRKKTAHLSSTNIVHRFAGVLADNGGQSVIALGFAGNTKVPLSFNQLQEFVTGDGVAREELPALDAIQLAIQSKSRDCVALRNVYSLVQAGKPASTKTLAVNAAGEGAIFNSPHICHQIDLFTHRVVKHVECVTQLTILRIEVDYVIDASDRIWLQMFQKVLVDGGGGHGNDEDAEIDDESASPSVSPSAGSTGAGGVLPPISGGARPQSEPHADEDAAAGAAVGTPSGPRHYSAPTNFKSRPPSKEAAAAGAQRPTPTPGGRLRAPLTGPVKRGGGKGGKGHRRTGSAGGGGANIKLRSLQSPAMPGGTTLGFAQRMQQAQGRRAVGGGGGVGGSGGTGSGKKTKKKKKALKPDSFEAKLDNASWEQLEKFRRQRQQQQRQQEEEEAAARAATGPSGARGARGGRSPSSNSNNNTFASSPQRRAHGRGAAAAAAAAAQPLALADGTHRAGGGGGDGDGKLEEMVAQLVQQQGKQKQHQDALERELHALRERLAAEVDAHQDAKEEVHTLSRQLAQANSKAAQRVAELENTHQQQIVAAQAMFHKELAARERLQDDATASSTAPITELISNVKELQQRIDFKEAAWAKERGALQDKHKAELQRLRKASQDDAARARADRQQRDDAVEDLQAKNAALGRELDARGRAEAQLKAKLDTLTKQRAELEREAQGLHKQLQSALGASSAAARGGGEGGGAAADELQSYRVATEASLRKQQHQIEYLESQLQAEGAYKTQLAAETDQLRAKYDMAKQECSELAAQFEAARQAEVRRLREGFETRLSGERDERQRAEDAAADAHATVAQLRNQVEAGQKAAQKAAAELETVVDERERYSDMVVELRQKVSALEVAAAAAQKRAEEAGGGSDGAGGVGGVSGAGGGGSTGSAASGALELQKLSNEVTYLRRQLENESQLKADLEDAMVSERMRSQGALRELTERVAQADDAASQAIGEAEQLRGRLETLAADKENHDAQHSAQLQDLQAKYDDVRAQVRDSGGEAFRLRNELAEAQRALDDLRSEHASEAERQRRQSEAHQRSLQAVESSLGSLSAGKDQEISQLRRKQAEALDQLGAAQQSTLQVRRALASEQVVGKRGRATTALFGTVNLWLKKKLMRAFNTLRGHAREAAAAARLEAAHAAATKRLAAEHAETAAAARAALEAEHAGRLAETAAEHEARRRALVEMQDAATKSALAEQQAQLEAELTAQLGGEHARAVDELRAVHAREAAGEVEAAAREAHAALEAAQAAAAADTAALRGELEAQSASHRGREEQLAAAKEEVLESATALLREKMEHEAKAALDAALADAGRAHARDMQANLDAARDALTAELAAAHAAERDALAAAHAKAADEVAAAHAQALAAQRAEADEALAAGLAELRGELGEAHAAETAALREEVAARAAAAEQAARVQHEALRAEATKVLRESHEKELAEARRQREATEAKAAALQTTAAELKAQLATLQGSLGVEHSQQLRAQEERHLASMRETLAESRKAADKRVGLLQEKHRQAEEDLKAEHREATEAAAAAAAETLKRELGAARAETQKLLTLLEKDKAAALEKLGQDRDRATEAAVAEARAAAAAAAAAAAEDAERAHAAKVKELEEDAEVEMQDRVLEAEVKGREALEAARAAAAAELAAARAEEDAARRGALQRLTESMKAQQQQVMQALKQESEALIRDFEEAIALLREEKGAAEKALAATQRSLEETEDMLYDSQQTASKMYKAGAAMRLRCTLLVVQCVGAVKKAQRQVRAEYEARIDAITTKNAAAAERMQAQLDGALERASKLDKIKLRMQDTLVHHKREVLMEHKVQSAVIHSDLAALSKKKEELSKRYRDLKDDMGMLKGSLSTLEAEIRDVSKRSALDDGEVDVEMLRRKRRLDKDMDELIEQVQAKQKQTRAVEAELGKVEDALEDKQDELKDLESQLVAVLMEQQKKMLALIGSVAGATSTLKAVGKFKRAVESDSDDDDGGGEGGGGGTGGRGDAAAAGADSDDTE